MSIVKTLTRYDAMLYPNNGKQGGRINLYCDDYKLYLLFPDPADAMGQNVFDATHKVGIAHQPIVQFENYLDLIRNEKPILVMFAPEDTPPSFVVYCASETPGEGEI